MTTEERLDRIEHLTAGITEERRKDREEYNALWRDTDAIRFQGHPSAPQQR